MNLIEMRVACMDMAVRMHEGKSSTVKEVFDTYDAILQKLTGDLQPELVADQQEGIIRPLGKA